MAGSLIDSRKASGELIHSNELRVGLGCMALTGTYGRIDRREAISTIHQALDLGIDHFDTAELYGPFINEELLADALGSHLANVRVATKFGYKLKHGRISGLDSRPRSIRYAVEGSLRRLRRERVELLYQHRVDPTVPIEDVVGTMAELVTEGKVGTLGMSGIDATTLRRAQAIHAISAVQNEYSLLHRQPETELLPALDDQETSFVPFSPLGRGILCGNASVTSNRDPADYRNLDARFAPNQLVKINVALRALWDISYEREIPPAVIALAWLLAKSPKVFVIPGAKSPGQIAISMQAAVFRLSVKDYERLNTVRVAEP